MSADAVHPHSARRRLRVSILVLLGVAVSILVVYWVRSPMLAANSEAMTLEAQRALLLLRMRQELMLTSDESAGVEEILLSSPILSQGNPRRTQHPMTREECWKRRALAQRLARPSVACSKPNMVVAFDPERGQTEHDAELCIDQFEFPNLPCEYPVVHVRAVEAALLCDAVGKRLCDAHEWEGACAGGVRPAESEYAWGLPRNVMTRLHNDARERVWAYGPVKEHTKCATQSAKTPGCGGGFELCGSNTYPSGAFPECVSPFGVYDQHGNVAEHMNLPLGPGELARDGSLGRTEMKGSWFIFAHFEAHPDDCRWRAKDWHSSAVLDPHSHSNYHLGFRCCMDLVPPSKSDR